MISLKKYQKLCAGDRDDGLFALEYLVSRGLVEKREQPNGSADLICKVENNPYVEAFFSTVSPGECPCCGEEEGPTDEELEREEEEFQNSPAGEFFATLNDIYFQLKELRYGREITDEVIETVGGMQRELHLACLAVVGGHTRKELDQLFRKNRRAGR
jgi:hypothetical protein